MVNRGRGILSESDREYLRMSDEERREHYSPSGRSKRRSAIRDRIVNAVMDTALLTEELEDDLLEDVIEELIDVEPDGEDIPTELPELLKSQTRFVYRAARAGILHAEDLIEDAVDEAEEERLAMLKQRYKDDPQSVDLGDVSDLYQAGVIGHDEYSDQFREKLRPPEPGATSLDDLAEFLGGEGDQDDDLEE